MEHVKTKEGLLLTRDPKDGLSWGSYFSSAFRPAETARKTANVSLFAAFRRHFGASLLGVVVICTLAAWSETSPAQGRSFRNRLVDTVDDVFDEFERHPWEMSAATLGVTLGIESAFVGLAFVLSSWGAADERFRDSLRNALKRLWLQTPHLVLAILVAGSVLAELDRSSRAWWIANPGPAWPTPPLPPNVAPTDPNYAQAQADYQKAMQDYAQAAQAAYRASSPLRPWYLRRADMIAPAACFSMALWFLWGVLAAIGSPRVVTPITRPPRCDQCGYELTLMPMEGRCPECGLPVIESLGLDARPGCVWEKRSIDGTWSAFWLCAVAAALYPVPFARTLSVAQVKKSHRQFLALHVPAALLVGFMLALLGFQIQTRDPWSSLREGASVGLMIFGPLAAGLFTLFTCLAATLAGLYERLRSGRNLMYGSIQMACYLSSFLVCFVAFAGITLLAVIQWHNARWVRDLEFWIGIKNAGVAALIVAWTVPVAVIGVRYFIALVRGTAAMRYANR